MFENKDAFPKNIYNLENVSLIFKRGIHNLKASVINVKRKRQK